jgi:hypothetical protein
VIAIQFSELLEVVLIANFLDFAIVPVGIYSQILRIKSSLTEFQSISDTDIPLLEMWPSNLNLWEDTVLFWSVMQIRIERAGTV